MYSVEPLFLPLQRSPRKQTLIIGCSGKVAFSSEVLQAEVEYYTCTHVTEKNNQPIIELRNIVSIRPLAFHSFFLLLFVCLFVFCSTR